MSESLRTTQPMKQHIFRTGFIKDIAFSSLSFVRDIVNKNIMYCDWKRTLHIHQLQVKYRFYTFICNAESMFFIISSFKNVSDENYFLRGKIITFSLGNSLLQQAAIKNIAPCYDGIFHLFIGVPVSQLFRTK